MTTAARSRQRRAASSAASERDPVCEIFVWRPVRTPRHRRAAPRVSSAARAAEHPNARAAHTNSDLNVGETRRPSASAPRARREPHGESFASGGRLAAARRCGAPGAASRSPGARGHCPRRSRPTLRAIAARQSAHATSYRSRWCHATTPRGGAWRERALTASSGHSALARQGTKGRGGFLCRCFV